MDNLIEKLHRFVSNQDKAKIESFKDEHPSGETIQLFAMKALSKKRMEELKDHLEYCWDCGKILADAEELQQISADVDGGILNVDYKMPSFEELRERAFGKSATEKVASAKASLVSSLNKLVGIRNDLLPLVQLYLGSKVQSAKSIEENKTEPIHYFDENGVKHQGKVMTVRDEDDLIIYTDIVELSEKTLGFEVNKNILAKCTFSKNEARIDEGMVARGFVEFKVDVSEETLSIFTEEFKRNKLDNLKYKLID